jgi:hypothetical protein
MNYSRALDWFIASLFLTLAGYMALASVAVFPMATIPSWALSLMFAVLALRIARDASKSPP